MFLFPLFAFSQSEIKENTKDIMIELGFCRDVGYIFNPTYMYMGGEAEDELLDICEVDSSYWIYFFEPNYYFIHIQDFGYCGSCGCATYVYSKVDSTFTKQGALNCMFLDIEYLPELVLSSTSKSHSNCWIHSHYQVNINNHNMVLDRISLTRQILNEELDMHKEETCPFLKWEENHPSILTINLMTQ